MLHQCKKTQNCIFETDNLKDLEWHEIECRSCCCGNERSGCPFNESAYNFYKQHYKECKYFKCENCELRGTSSEVSLHAPICDYRRVLCELCGTLLGAKFLELHIESCKNVKIDCQFCGEFILYGRGENREWDAHYWKCLPSIAEAFDKFVLQYGKVLIENLLVKGFESKYSDKYEIKPFAESIDDFSGIKDYVIVRALKLTGDRQLVKKAYMTLLIREGLSKCLFRDV